MLPTKEELEKNLLDKMTNQDIAKIYKITFLILAKNPLFNDMVV
ncbi:hypothetical protein [Heyndrickxia acidicola]|uniref:Uncharacterized protein n=1 Tax=Heyndrickxia acidicola TaxID=209389 RepID=A0ABU6MEK3_9BACI|nr:hypothetical protein [Heyndrickxia acidicola]MED1203074.1 hypothetical protein [Heyndrickxia acidicola]